MSRLTHLAHGRCRSQVICDLRQYTHAWFTFRRFFFPFSSFPFCVSWLLAVPVEDLRLEFGENDRVFCCCTGASCCGCDWWRAVMGEEEDMVSPLLLRRKTRTCNARSSSFVNLRSSHTVSLRLCLPYDHFFLPARAPSRVFEQQTAKRMEERGSQQGSPKVRLVAATPSQGCRMRGRGSRAKLCSPSIR